MVGVTSKEMQGVYDRLVDKRHPARVIYDEILNATEVCPSCGHYKPRTLDHYLPKARFPALAVDPSNLVPACRDCNFVKLSKTAVQADHEGFHPYFSDAQDHVWLAGRVLETSPATVEFFVDPPSHWDDVIRVRAEHHFSTFGLGELYTTLAGTLVSGVRKFVDANLYALGGSAMVRNWLASMAVSYSDHEVNGWQSAAYTALSKSDWYCEGGFNAN
ncbi:HNH endonuclease [Micromonospora purpureochromogenes]|uniref:HNH endonuclease n=1 Tax=Micromonospora purpureochromogenes TaxID=47872 RepID=A0ABX2RUB3_9ACTN|nr:hypothetical protein [Micromonospora purpureochromogenes]NYF58813.1 hypothetical protein [Micromonospora purpureochromogenes]